MYLVVCTIIKQKANVYVLLIFYKRGASLATNDVREGKYDKNAWNILISSTHLIEFSNSIPARTNPYYNN